MPTSRRRNVAIRIGVVGGVAFWLLTCGDGGTGAEEEKTGAVLQGQVVKLGGSSETAGVEISIGAKSVKTGSNGSFSIPDIPLGQNTVTFSGSGITGPYSLSGVETGTIFRLDEVEVAQGQVTTKHTGTWVGTAGSSEPGSEGQIAFTLIIQANGNALTGTGSVAPPDNSVWSMSGKETGMTVDGEMTLVSSNSECAAGATFNGSFVADTLSGTFTEVNPPAGCGAPESGLFRVVKQEG